MTSLLIYIKKMKDHIYLRRHLEGDAYLSFRNDRQKNKAGLLPSIGAITNSFV